MHSHERLLVYILRRHSSGYSMSVSNRDNRQLNHAYASLKPLIHRTSATVRINLILPETRHPKVCFLLLIIYCVSIKRPSLSSLVTLIRVNRFLVFTTIWDVQ